MILGGEGRWGEGKAGGRDRGGLGVRRRCGNRGSCEAEVEGIEEKWRVRCELGRMNLVN